MGLSASIRRPKGRMIRSIKRRTSSSFSKTTVDFINIPFLSIYTSLAPLIMTSVISGSSRSWWGGGGGAEPDQFVQNDFKDKSATKGEVAASYFGTPVERLGNHLQDGVGPGMTELRLG